MNLQCDSCGAENPAVNRYCGQCGSALKPRQTAAGIPEEFWRQPGPSGLSEAKQQPEHDLPNALPGLHTAEATVSDHILHENVLHRSPRTASTGVSGPSFLGLSDDNAPVYEDLLADETGDEPQSHIRRNIAVAVMALAAFLIVLQWRSIRSYGLAYVQNGTMPVPSPALPQNALPRNPAAMAASNVKRDPASPPSPGVPSSANSAAAESGVSQSAAPQSATASQNAKSSLATSQAPALQNENGQGANNRSEPSSPQLSTATPPSQPSSMSAPRADVPAPDVPAPDVPANVAEAKVAGNATGNSLAAPSSARPSAVSSSGRRASASAASFSSAAGSQEMLHAANASDSEARAAWLWRAVGKGNPQAPVELAKMYEQGNGVVRSCAQASLLLRAASSRGNQQAKLALRQLYYHGGCSAR